MKKLEGHVCVVTGGGAGLGKGIARRIASEGAVTIIAELNSEAGETAAEEIRIAGGEAIAFKCDVSKEEDVIALVKASKEKFGKIDLLCNNTGVSLEARNIIRIEDLTEEQWDLMFNVGLKSIFFTCKHIIPEMIKAGGGSIVNIASVAGTQPTFGAAYGAVKAGVIGITKALAVQYADSNIRCNSVSPGAMQTPGGAAAANSGVFKDVSGHRAKLINRFGTPDDVGAAVTFLLSDEASYITAANLAVDGGCLSIVSKIPPRTEKS